MALIKTILFKTTKSTTSVSLGRVITIAAVTSDTILVADKKIQVIYILVEEKYRLENQIKYLMIFIEVQIHPYLEGDDIFLYKDKNNPNIQLV